MNVLKQSRTHLIAKGERALMLEINYEIVQQRKNGYSDRRLAIEIVEIFRRFIREGRVTFQL